MIAWIVCWLIEWDRSTGWQTRLLRMTRKTLCIIQGLPLQALEYELSSVSQNFFIRVNFVGFFLSATN